jgi:hypothetical protein
MKPVSRLRQWEAFAYLLPATCPATPEVAR